MKKLWMFFTVILVFGCKNNEADLLFGKLPEERISERLAELQNKLAGSEAGWVASLTTSASGGYGFYMKFNADQTVDMYGDLSETSASEKSTSTYRTKWVMNASLIFDTYNYITLLQDPTPSAYGGASGTGLKSDIEFEYIRSTEDSVILRGKKYQNELKLVKATNEQEIQYEKGGFVDNIENLIDFVTENHHPFFSLTSGNYSTNVEISLDYTAKKVSFTGVSEDGTVITSNAPFCFAVDGAELIGDLEYSGVKFSKLQWKSGILNVMDAEANEYPLSNSISPVVPLYKAMGIRYSSLYSPFKTIFPGTTSAGADILNFFHNNLENGYTGFGFNYGDITLTWDATNHRVQLIGFSSQNGGGSGWETTIVYDYTMDENGIFTFVLRSEASGGYVSSILQRLSSFMLGNRVKFDYFIDGSSEYGKMSSVNDPSIEMTFELQ